MIRANRFARIALRIARATKVMAVITTARRPEPEEAEGSHLRTLSHPMIETFFCPHFVAGASCQNLSGHNYNIDSLPKMP